MVVHSRRVAFHEGSNKVHSIHPLSLDEANDVWYNSIDFELMRRRDLVLIRKLELNQAPCENYRGLESRVPTLSLPAKVAMVEALEAVLEEQGRQKKVKRSNPQLIRRRYEIVTAEYAHIAHQRALEDAKVARAIHEEDFSCTCLLLPSPQEYFACGGASSLSHNDLLEGGRQLVESVLMNKQQKRGGGILMMSPNSKGKPSIATSVSSFSAMLVVNNRQ